MKIKDLPHEFFIVKDGNVEALATKIKGNWIGCAKVVVNCLNTCCDGDQAKFLASNKKFSLSRFQGCSLVNCPSKKNKK
jgi:hypothetical protein